MPVGVENFFSRFFVQFFSQKKRKCARSGGGTTMERRCERRIGDGGPTERSAHFLFFWEKNWTKKREKKIIMAPRGALSRSLRKSHEGGRGIDRGVGPLVPRHTTRGASRRSSNDDGRRVRDVLRRTQRTPRAARPYARGGCPGGNTKRCTRRRRHGRRVSCGARSLEAHRALRSVVGWSHGTSTL